MATTTAAMSGTRVRERAEVSTSVHDGTIRAAGVIGLLGIGLIHFIDFFGKWHETRYMAWLFLALVASTVLASFLLLGQQHAAGWVLGGAVSALTLAGYIINRTWGLPSAKDDIGNWTEPLGVASLFIEGFVFLLAIGVLTGALSTADRSKN